MKNGSLLVSLIECFLKWIIILSKYSTLFCCLLQWNIYKTAKIRLAITQYQYQSKYKQNMQSMYIYCYSNLIKLLPRRWEKETERALFKVTLKSFLNLNKVCQVNGILFTALLVCVCVFTSVCVDMCRSYCHCYYTYCCCCFNETTWPLSLGNLWAPLDAWITQIKNVSININEARSQSPFPFPLFHAKTVRPLK